MNLFITLNKPNLFRLVQCISYISDNIILTVNKFIKNEIINAWHKMYVLYPRL